MAGNVLYTSTQVALAKELEIQVLLPSTVATLPEAFEGIGARIHLDSGKRFDPASRYIEEV